MDIIHSYASKVPAGYRKLQLTEEVATVDLPSGTSRVTIQAENKSIRYRDDGRAPTVTDGMAIANGAAPFDLYSVTENLKLISQTTDAGVNATANLASAAVNSDIDLVADAVGSEYNGYTFITDADANAGVNAIATLDITAANGDLTFTAPVKSDEYNGTQFVADSQGAESVTYNVNTDIFTLNYNAATSNGSAMKTVFDAAITANPTWPQWACAIEGNGNGVWDVGDDGANATSAGGVNTVDPYVEFSANTFTIHILDTGANTANQVATLIDTAMAAHPAWPQFEATPEGAGGGVVDDAISDVTSNGADPVGAVVHLNFYRDSEL